MCDCSCIEIKGPAGMMPKKGPKKDSCPVCKMTCSDEMPTGIIRNIIPIGCIHTLLQSGGVLLSLFRYMHNCTLCNRSPSVLTWYYTL